VHAHIACTLLPAGMRGVGCGIRHYVPITHEPAINERAIPRLIDCSQQTEPPLCWTARQVGKHCLCERLVDHMLPMRVCCKPRPLHPPGPV
jgi:hypothetical protein